MRRTIFIGQARARPGSQHETPGTYLQKWLHQIGLSDTEIAESCFFTALMAEFPGATKHGHIAPSKADVAAAKERIANEIVDFQSELVVPVGQLSIELILEISAPLSETVGQVFHRDPLHSIGRKIPIIPLPHPSGRSTWTYFHQALLEKALQNLQRYSKE